MVAAARAIVNGPRMSSRERVLERIKKANSKAAGLPESIPRRYDCGSTQSADETVALFEERLQDYDARVFRIRSNEIAAKAAEILLSGNRKRIVVPDGSPKAWRTDGLAWIPDDELSEVPPIDLKALAGRRFHAQKGAARLQLRSGGMNIFAQDGVSSAIAEWP